MRVEAVIDVELEIAGVDFGEVQNLVDGVEQMRPALADAVEIFPLPPVYRAGGAARQHFRKPDDGVERGAQLVAHIGEKLRFGDVGGFGLRFGLAQQAFGADLLADVAGGSAVALELTRAVEDRPAADRNRLLALVSDFPRVGEVAKRVVAVQNPAVNAPLLDVAVALRYELPARAAEPAGRILAKGANMVGKVAKAVVAVAFPIPIGAAFGEVAQPRLAVAPRRLSLLVRFGAPGQGAGGRGHGPEHVVDFGNAGAGFRGHSACAQRCGRLRKGGDRPDQPGGGDQRDAAAEHPHSRAKQSDFSERGQLAPIVP